MLNPNKYLNMHKNLLKVFKVLTLLAFIQLMAFKKLNAQSNASYAELNVNNIKAGFSSNGSLFRDINDPLDGYAKFTGSLYGDTAAMVFASNLWVSGVLNNDSLVAANAYLIRGEDFFFGPVSQQYDSIYDKKYNKVWKVTKAQIDHHINNYQNTGYALENAILNWPAHGDVAHGEAQVLAPFYDVNQNGYYDPFGGDYPIIKGDEAVYFIFNDARASKTETGSDPLNIEVHGMAYAYASADSALQNTVFISYKVYNRGTSTIDNLKLGVWTDFDLGNSLDDIIISDSINSLSICYNGDMDDEGPFGFGSNPPAVGVKFLSEAMSGSMNYMNGTSAGNPAATSDPANTKEYFYYLDQKWKDGRPLVRELPHGDGYNDTLQSRARFQYSGNWSPSISNIADVRNVSTNYNQQLVAGSSACLELAFFAARDTSGTDLFGSVNKLIVRGNALQQFYDSRNEQCVEAVVGLSEEEVLAQLKFYPNPVHDVLYVSANDLKSISRLEILNLSGQRIKTKDHDLDHISVHDLPKGVYILSVHTKAGNSSHSKFIKY